MGVDQGNLFPSVRCCLEGALLSALANAKGVSMAEVLLGKPLEECRSQGSGVSVHTPERGVGWLGSVEVNGLLECQGSPAECAAEAVRLVSAGFKKLKIKVMRVPCALRMKVP